MYAREGARDYENHQATERTVESTNQSRVRQGNGFNSPTRLNVRRKLNFGWLTNSGNDMTDPSVRLSTRDAWKTYSSFGWKNTFV